MPGQTALRVALVAVPLLFAACQGGSPSATPSSNLAPSLPFRDGFEEASDLLDLFPLDGSRWSGYQLEPEGNTALLDRSLHHAGDRSLRLNAVPYDGRNASKADVQLEGLAFSNGEHVWFSGWFYLEQAADSRWLFLWDIEETARRNSPGRRLYLDHAQALASDLGKWWTGHEFRQAPTTSIPFPQGRWVELVVHLYLSQAKDGIMEVWQDGALVLEGRGQTLPTESSVYDRMQVGITANGNEEYPQVLYIDDLVLSIEPLR